MMNRQQTITIAIFVALFFSMYFGCDYIPKNHQSHDKSATSKESVSNDEIITHAQEHMNPEDRMATAALEKQLSIAATDTARVGLMKKISGAYYKAHQPAASGHYAEIIANQESTERAWMIAGSMFLEGIEHSDEVQERKVCTEKAIKAFENARAINPKNIEHDINIALCYATNPPQDNPMKGILMLKDLEAKSPDNTKVLFQLARMAMRTGQFGKAIERLEQILKLEPNTPAAVCLIADAYRQNGDATKSAIFAKKCEEAMK